MAINLLDVMGSPNIGIYCLATDHYIIVPPKLPRSKIERLESYLKVRAISTTVGDTRLIGVMAVANSNGIVLPVNASDEELRAVRSAAEGSVERVLSRRNAFGNMVLANDMGAVVDPRLARDRRVVRGIEDVLGVEAVSSEVAGLPNVGSLAVATNRWVLAHPMLREDEKELLEKALKVPVDVGTVNCGVPFVKCGLVSNRFGAVVGPLTTGPELILISHLFEL